MNDTAPGWARTLVDDISSIEGVVSIDQACSLLKNLTTSSHDVLSSVRFDERFYTRTSIFRTSVIEVLIMGWLPGQMSPPHNHKGSICAVKVLTGDALEVNYSKNRIGLLVPREVVHFSCDSLTVSEDEQIHQFGNGGETKMVSLHVYSPPLHAAEIFPESASILSGNTLKSMISNDSAPLGGNSLPIDHRVV